MMPLESAAKVVIAVHSAADLAEDNCERRWSEALESLRMKVREAQGA